MADVDAETAHKTGIAKQKKDAGDQAFKQGETTTGTLVLPAVFPRGIDVTCVSSQLSEHIMK